MNNNSTLSPNGKIIRLSVSIAEGKFRLSINAAKLLFLVINDFAEYASSLNSSVNDETFKPRTVHVEEVGLFDAKNLYDTIKHATCELASSFILIQLNDEKRFSTVQWFRTFTYWRGWLTYEFDPRLYEHIINLGAKHGKKLYVSISPIILSNFYSMLALRIYLLAKLNFVRHKTEFKLSPLELAEMCQLKSSYYPKRPGYLGGSKYALSHQKNLIEEALKNINENTDISVKRTEFVNRRGKVHEWKFEFEIGQTLKDNEIYYKMIADGSYGDYPVCLTKSQYETIKREFPGNWERMLSDLAMWQEQYGVQYKEPLWAVRRMRYDGIPTKKKLKKNPDYLDPPLVFVNGKVENVSDDFFKTFFKNKSKTDVTEPDAPVPDAPIPDAPVPDAPIPDAPVPDAPVPDIAGSSNDDDWPFPF